MTAKFTPGPWRVEDRTIYVLQHYGWRKGVEEFENRFSAHVQGSPRGAKEDELQANANLIAAAPDLYNVAKYVFDNCDMDSVLQALVDKALAKADGVANEQH